MTHTEREALRRMSDALTECRRRGIPLGSLQSPEALAYRQTVRAWERVRTAPKWTGCGRDPRDPGTLTMPFASEPEPVAAAAQLTLL